jgi:hypothetical protein
MKKQNEDKDDIIEQIFPEDKHTKSKREAKERLQKEQDRIDIAIKKRDETLKKFDLNIQKVHDLEYLKDIFSPKFDKYKSQDFLLKTRKKLIKSAYPDVPALNEYLFWITISRRLHIMYQKFHAQLEVDAEIQNTGKDDLEFLKRIELVSERVGKLQELLEKSRDRKEKISDVVDLFSKTMKDAENFVKENIGEHTFRCNNCGTIVQADGLPHYAIMTETDDNKDKIYHIYSKEAAHLVKNGVIPLHVMAFILRTSPEGIIYTMKQRGEDPKTILSKTNSLKEEEEKLTALRGELEIV